MCGTIYQISLGLLGGRSAEENDLSARQKMTNRHQVLSATIYPFISSALLLRILDVC